MVGARLREHLANLARDLLDQERVYPTATGWGSHGARYELERFVERARKGAFGTRDLHDQQTLIVVVRLLERVLAVDSRKPANRKGDIPAALGLVDRAENDLRDRIVCRLIDEARYETGIAGRALKQCYAAVVQALAEAGIEPDRGVQSIDLVKKIYQRMSQKPHDKATQSL